MDQDIKSLETKIDALQVEVTKMRKYFMASLWVTIILFVLPLIGLMFAIPTFMSTYSAVGDFSSNLGI